MQKKSYKTMRYKEIFLPEQFPISHIRHRQGYQTGDYLHFHNGIEIGLCTEGSGVFFVGNRTHSFSAGDVSVIFADQPHIAQSPEQMESRWFFLVVDSENLCRLLGYSSACLSNHAPEDKKFPIIFRKEEHPQVCQTVQEIFSELEQQNDYYQTVVLHKMMCLFLEILRCAEARNTATSVTDPIGYDCVAPAIHYICVHYRENFPLSELAKACNLSQAQFLRNFKQVMEYTPSEYLLRVRMNIAKNLLISTEESVLNIALQCGFNSISTFNRNFRQLFSVTPTEYQDAFRLRRKNRTGNAIGR